MTLNNLNNDDMEALEMSWLNSTKVYKTCPKCKKGQLDTRVKKNPLIKTFFFFLDLKRYKCSHCEHTFYLSTKGLLKQ